MAHLGHWRSMWIFPWSLTIFRRRQGNLDFGNEWPWVSCNDCERLKNTYDICTIIRSSLLGKIVATFSSAIHGLWRTTTANGRYSTPIPRFLLHIIGWNGERFLWLGPNRWHICRIKSARVRWDRIRRWMDLIYRCPFPGNGIAWKTFCLCDIPKRCIYSWEKNKFRKQ